jgi:putative membrane protein
MFVAAAAVVVLGAGAVGAAQQQQQDQQGQQGRDRSRQQAGQQDSSDQARQAGDSSRGGQANQQGQGQGQGQGQAGRTQPADHQIEQLLAKIAEDPDTAADKVFLMTAVLNNQVQIQLAQQVMQKTQNGQVKRLAQRMVQDLSKEDQDLRQIAQSLGLQIPEGLARADAMEVDIVAALPADQMDKAYVASVEADGAADASSFGSQAQISQNDRVRQIATQQGRSQQDRSQEATQTAQAIGMRGNEPQPAGAQLRGTGGSDRRDNNNR